MTDEKKPSNPQPVADDRTAAHKMTRRRFTKAGAVAPVIMTLGARPVWGQACSPSAVGSLSHTSHNPSFDIADCKFSCTPDQLSNAGLTGNLTTLGFSYPTCNCGNNGKPCENRVRQIRTLYSAPLSSVLARTVKYAPVTGNGGEQPLDTNLAAAAAEAVAAVLNVQYDQYLNSQVPAGQQPYEFYKPPIVSGGIKDAFVSAASVFCSDGKTAALESYATTVSAANSAMSRYCPYALT